MAIHPMQHYLYCPCSELEDLVKRLVMVSTNERHSFFLTGTVTWLTLSLGQKNQRHQYSL